MFDSDTYCFVDVETTGLSPKWHRIIEIAVLKVKNHRIIDKFETLINPQTHVDPFIEKLTGIRIGELERAPMFHEINDELFKLLKGSVFVAHNARFDYGFVKNEFQRAGIEFSAVQLCTAKLARLLYPQYKRYSLDNIISHFDIGCQRRHRAYDDANVIRKFFRITEKQFSHEILSRKIKFLTKRPTAPPGLPVWILDKLPETSGVYIFYGESDFPLYVGKSLNIKDRVMSHFRGDYSRPLDLKISSQIKHIDTHKTPGELSALILETNFIRKLKPLYNRQNRTADRLTALVKIQNKNGYNIVKPDYLDNMEVNSIDSVVAVFKSQKQVKENLVKIAHEYNLCPKLLQIEKTRGACFSYQIKKCYGACVNKEFPLKYNLRFDEAFYKSKIQKWPFTGPVLIRENGSKSAIAVDKWCILGEINEFDGIINLKQKYNFDYNIYKILKNQIKLNTQLRISKLNTDITEDRPNDYRSYYV